MLSPPQIICLIVIALALLLLVTEWMRSDLVAMAAVVVLIGGGVLTPEQALKGFGSEPVVAVIGAFVLSAAVVNTGLAERLASWVMRVAGTHLAWGMIVLMLAAALLSALTHHLLITALMVPIAGTVATRGGFSVSRLLMPVSLAASIGTTLTLIGAPAFLVADHVLQEAGREGLGIFSLTPIGVALVVCSLVYMALPGRWLLPERVAAGSSGERFALEDYYTEILIRDGAPQVGQTFAAIAERYASRFEIVDWLRGGDPIRHGRDERRLEAGDVLLVRSTPEGIAGIADEKGLALHAVAKYGEAHETQGAEAFGDERLAQLVIAPRSYLSGRAVGEVDFRERYGVIVVGLWRRDGWMRGELAGVHLQPGDTLVVWGEPAQLDRLGAQREFLMALPFPARRLRRSRAWWALGILGGSVIAAATELLSVHVAFLTGAIGVVVARCLSAEEAYAALELRVIAFIAGALALGAALEQTGLTALAAAEFAPMLQDFSPFWILILVFSAGAIVTQVLSDAATVVLLAPIVARMAEPLGLAPEALVASLAIGAVAAFLTPLGHHGNLLVYLPGGYRFGDFFRVGAPLTVLFAAITAFVALALWPAR
ncbi:MAG TPA: SLC13 family permease [Tahibacter sp.]|uniref:SLC13 family permease n=1 Tax=Tahibacter sp. TaxID=2056211 RepID=UPI002BD57E1C|nr:SLC13 family permease [Tahibacter sp.]HSX62394.1 SLC13 family permease [Tahibacter sp.]